MKLISRSIRTRVGKDYLKIGVVLMVLVVGGKLVNQPVQAAIPTGANFKVAFIGDSGAGSHFQSVLNLIKSEGADMVLHQGDFDYSDGPTKWMGMIDNTLGANFPYFGSDGNHDNWDSDGYAAFFKDRMSRVGLTPPSGSLPPSYAITYNGLKVVFSEENGDPTHIDNELRNDDHLWKVCSWHKNMTTMQVGGKGNEQGWPDYETCRQYGAIIATGHEHSYERTKTLTSTQNLTVDLSQHPLQTYNGIPNVPSNPNSLLVAPGKTIVFVSGLGGNSIRSQQRCSPYAYPYGGGSGCNYIWGGISTSDQGANYGALFITFNINGNPNRAHAYFKNINGQVIDEFDISASGTAVTPVPTATPPPGCVVAQADGVWKNKSMTTQTGSFTTQFDATPIPRSGDTVGDMAVGLSDGSASAYTDLAAIVRFAPSGNIDVRNDGSYGADTTIGYSGGSTYHVRMVVDVQKRTYSVDVRLPDSSEYTALAGDYAFRSEQGSVTQLNNWAVNVNTGTGYGGTLQACDFSAGSVVVTPTAPPVIINFKQWLVNWLTSVGDLNGDGKVNSWDWGKVISG